MRCEDCASIIVWTVPHLEPAVQAAAERVNDGCFRYAVAPRADASGQAALLGGERPDVWIPVSAAWPGLVAQDGVQLQVGETIASSPVLLAGAAPVINALEQSGVGRRPHGRRSCSRFCWRAGQPGSKPRSRCGWAIRGPTRRPCPCCRPPAAKPVVGPKRTAAGGMLALLAHTAIPDDPLTALAADPTAVVPATEHQVGAAQDAGREVAGLAPADGLSVVQIPFVRVGDGSEEGVDALERQLTSPAAAGDLQELRLRPGASGPAPGVEGVPEDVPATATEVDPRPCR